MRTSRIGLGAAVAWAFSVCAAVTTPALAGGDLAPEPVYRGVIVSGGDFTENAREGYLGFYYALNRDLSREGFIVRLLGTRGFYEYTAGGDFDARYWQGDAMLGYQWVRGGVDVALYLGVDVQSHKISPDDPLNDLRGQEAGLKVAFDLESNGSGGSPLYLALIGSYSTAFDTYYVLGRVGRNFGRFTIGPEAWALGDVSGDAQRLGAFVSFDVPLGHTTGTLAFSGGYQFGDDSVANQGFEEGGYGTIGFRVPLGR